MNNTLQRTIGFTPSKVLFDVNQRGSSEGGLRKFLENDQPSNRDLDLIRELAEERTIEVQNYNKSQYVKKRKIPNKFQVDDFLMIINTDVTPGINKKLIPKYRGPYVIKKVLLGDRYLLTDPEGFQHTQILFEGVYDASRLKPWLNEKFNATLDVS